MALKSNSRMSDLLEMSACLAKPAPRRKPPHGKVPRPPGATVQMKHATGREPELLRHRAMLDAVCRVTFPYPAGRFEGRGIVICGGGEKYLPSVYVLVRLLRHLRCRLRHGTTKLIQSACLILAISVPNILAQQATEYCPRSDEPLEREAEMVWHYSKVPNRSYDFVGRGRIELIEAAGEYCRDKGLEFHKALPHIWERYCVLFAGRLPSKSGEREEKWGIVSKDEGRRGDVPWSLSLVILHPKGERAKSTTAQELMGYTPNHFSYVSKDSGGYGTVAWLQNDGSDLGVVVLDQGRTYAAIRPWVWQSITKLRVRSDGIKKLWEKSTTIHEVSLVDAATLNNFSIKRTQPRVILAEPDAHAQAAGRAAERAISPAEQLRREVQLVTPYARGDMSHSAVEKIDPRSEPALIEAAGEYCRDKGVEFEAALPRIWATHSVMGIMPLMPLPRDGEQEWGVIYRNNGGKGDKVLRLSMIILHTKRDRPRPMTSEQRNNYHPQIRSIAARGFTSSNSIAWFEGEGQDCGIVVFEQGQPKEKHPWFFQTVAKYRVRPDSITRLWKETNELHAVNYIPTHEMIRYSQRGFQPVIKLAPTGKE